MSKELIWKRMHAGMKLPGDAIVMYDHDPDPRLSRTAIYDGYYILARDLWKAVPKEDKR